MLKASLGSPAMTQLRIFTGSPRHFSSDMTSGVEGGEGRRLAKRLQAIHRVLEGVKNTPPNFLDCLLHSSKRPKLP